MPSRTVLSTSCSGHIASATGIFKAGSVRSDLDGSLPRPAKLFDPEPFRTTDYAFGVKKPRRKQIRQRPYSSSARGVVPACPARCLKWSPNVQMPAPSGTRIGAVSSAVRGVEALFPIVAHGITPIDVAAGSWKFPHGVSPLSPAERLLARLALLWLACPSCRQWEAASRPVPQMRLRPFFGGAGVAFSSAMLRRSASMRFAAFCGRGAARSRDTGRPACFFLSIATTASS